MSWGNPIPARDKEIIELELALSDLAVVEKRLDKVKRSAKSADKDALAELPSLEHRICRAVRRHTNLARFAYRRRARAQFPDCNCSRQSRLCTLRIAPKPNLPVTKENS